MKFMKKLSIVAAALTMLISGAAQASVTVGNSYSGNCYPYSCFASDMGTEYQQVFSSSAFSSPIAINRISVSVWKTGIMDSATYTLSLSTTSKGVNGLDTSNIANNIGADNQLFGTFTLGGNMPNVLTFNGTTFNYNPTAGNLLLDITVSDVTNQVGYESYFKADYAGLLTSRVWTDPSGTSQGTGGLVTKFDSVIAVPEPETYAMLLAGLGLMGFMTRRKSGKKAA